MVACAVPVDVRVTACAVAMDDTVAVSPALAAFADTIRVAATAALLLGKLTLKGPLAAAALRATVQATVPDPVMDPLSQRSQFNATGAAGVSVTPRSEERRVGKECR